MFSSSSARSGITLLLLPAWMLPTVNTADSPGATSPRDDGLQPNDDHRGKDHRVDRGLRHGTVRAAAVDLDAHAVGGRQHSPGTGANLAGRCGQDVLGECNIDSGQQFRKTV